MNSRASPEAMARIEALYRAAEIRATRKQAGAALPAGISEEHLPSKPVLLASASRELDRYAVRQRYLPAELCSDGVWRILLHLLASELQGVIVGLSGSARIWVTSEATAARQIAALIEANFVKRMFGDRDDERISLSLTARGRYIVSTILALSD